MYEGRPFRGELHSADASGGVVIPLYEDGSLTAYTLKDNEYLVIHSVELISAAGGDTFLFIGADGTEGAGEYIVRGTVAANGGIVQELIPPHSGDLGYLVYAQAPNGAVDAVIRGFIRTGKSNDYVKESWKATDYGQ